MTDLSSVSVELDVIAQRMGDLVDLLQAGKSGVTSNARRDVLYSESQRVVIDGQPDGHVQLDLMVFRWLEGRQEMKIAICTWSAAVDEWADPLDAGCEVVGFRSFQNSKLVREAIEKFDHLFGQTYATKLQVEGE